MRKICRVTLAVGVVLSLWAPAAHAYILPADFLARLWADTRRPSLKDATLTMTLTHPGEDKGVEARLYLKRPERLRWVRGEDGEQITIINEGQQAQGSATELGPVAPSDDLVGLLMLPRGKDLDETSARIIEGARSVGVDSNITTIGRHADGVAYIVGAHSWETAAAQLWFDKATFVPVRVIWRGKSRRSDEVVWRQLRLLSWNLGWPRALEWWENDQLVERAEVSGVAVNQSLPETLFDLSGAKGRRREH